VPGKLYVDSICVDCDACRENAPNNSVTDEDEGHSYVFSQPKDAEEEAQCGQAVKSCPVEAIGDDGDESQCALLRTMAMDRDFSFAYPASV
jgi:ferredoxin